MVRRQRQQAGSTGQGAPPVGEPLGQRALGEPGPLPYRVVGVLQRRLGERRGAARPERGVQRGQFVEEDAERPAVEDRVVEDQDQGVLGRVRADQQRAEQRVAGQVERAGQLLLGRQPYRRGTLRRRERADVSHRQPDRAGVVDHLYRGVVLGGEGGPQHLVPADDLRQAAFEQGGVEDAAHRHRPAQVVRGAVTRRHDLVEEPQRALRHGRGHGRGTGEPRPQRGRAGIAGSALPPEQPESLRRQGGDGQTVLAHLVTPDPWCGPAHPACR